MWASSVLLLQALQGWGVLHLEVVVMLCSSPIFLAGKGRKLKISNSFPLWGQTLKNISTKYEKQKTHWALCWNVIGQVLHSHPPLHKTHNSCTESFSCFWHASSHPLSSVRGLGSYKGALPPIPWPLCLSWPMQLKQKAVSCLSFRP